MKNITDEEIQKALECCISAENCCECVYTKMCDGTTIHQFALDLIKRKDSKIAELNEEINRQKAEVEWLKQIQSDNEKAFNKMTELYNRAFNRCKTIKAEAIREFAERLKENLVYCKTVVEGNDMVGITDVGYEKEDAIATIDNLLEEMGGEDK